MQDVNICFPATPVSASLYTKDGIIAMSLTLSTALHFVSESLQENGTHSSFQIEEIHYRRNLVTWLVDEIRSHTKISGARSNSTLRDKGTRRGKGVAEAAEVGTKAVLSSGRRSCPAAAGAMEDMLLRAEMGNQVPIMSPWRD